MIESDSTPETLTFDVAIVAVGYERRCRWLFTHQAIETKLLLGLEFGYLADGSYGDNVAFFKAVPNCKIINGISLDSSTQIADAIHGTSDSKEDISILLDISSMSRSMIANAALGIQALRRYRNIHVTVSYLPSKFAPPAGPSPIRLASPIKPDLAGWSPRPERPVGVVCGLGFEEGLALGALQFLEPAKAWIFVPVGVQSEFDNAVRRANQHIGDIFDTSQFHYQINQPTFTRGKLEALLNSVSQDFRVVVVPFGPKIFAWLALTTIVFCGRRDVGIWTFSSKEQERVVDRDAEGSIIWHSIKLPRLQFDDHTAGDASLERATA
jgi:hypothetical protein